MAEETPKKLYPTFSEEATDETQSLLVNNVAQEPYVHHHHPPEDDLKPKYEIFFVVMPLFCGYACLFALQRKIKQVYGISDNGSYESHLYGVAASFVYIGNLVFRLGHNFFFAWAQPRTRVLISMSSMALSMAIICGIFFVFHHPSIAWVFVAYALGGIGIGTFESNVLSTITPLGKNTKFWAIVAIPTGILAITVGGFALMQLANVDAGYIYLGVFVYIVFGIILFIVRFYRLPSSNANAVSFLEFLHQLRGWREWLPKIMWHSIALLVDMFCVSMFSPGVMLYLFDAQYVTFPWFHDAKLATNWLFVIFDAGFFIGDTLSRRIFYKFPAWNHHPKNEGLGTKIADLFGGRSGIIVPLFFWFFAAIGVGLGLSNISFLVPFSGFFVAFCNGSIYAQANRKIDSTIDKKYNLIAFSFWLFIGDIGSVIGSNTISYVSVAVKNLYS